MDLKDAIEPIIITCPCGATVDLTEEGFLWECDCGATFCSADCYDQHTCLKKLSAPDEDWHIGRQKDKVFTWVTNLLVGQPCYWYVDYDTVLRGKVARTWVR